MRSATPNHDADAPSFPCVQAILAVSIRPSLGAPALRGVVPPALSRWLESLEFDDVQRIHENDRTVIVLDGDSPEQPRNGAVIGGRNVEAGAIGQHESERFKARLAQAGNNFGDDESAGI